MSISHCFQHTYSEDDCTFREQVLPNGYNVYMSVRHGTLLSLGNHRQRMQGRDRAAPALAQFLPRISILNQTSYPGQDVPDQIGQMITQTEEPADTMDSFGKLSQIIHSPSFHKRWESCYCIGYWLNVNCGVVGLEPEVIHSTPNAGKPSTDCILSQSLPFLQHPSSTFLSDLQNTVINWHHLQPQPFTEQAPGEEPWKKPSVHRGRCVENEIQIHEN